MAFEPTRWLDRRRPPDPDRQRGLPASIAASGRRNSRARWPREEGLALTPAHWEVIRFLRDYYFEHGVQAQVRVMIKHFTDAWGPERGSNHHLHDMFPRGGPQKQGNRLRRSAAHQRWRAFPSIDGTS